MITYLIKAPQDNTQATSAFDEMYSHQLYEKSASLFEEVFTQFHEALDGYQCSFEMLATSQNVAFYFTAEEVVAEVVKALIYSVAPAADIIPVKDPIRSLGSFKHRDFAEVSLKRRSVLPIKDYKEIEGDSLSGLLNIMCKLDPGEVVCVQLLARPKRDSTLHHLQLGCSSKLAMGSHFFHPKYLLKRGLSTMVRDKMKEKTRSRLFAVNFRMAAVSNKGAKFPKKTLQVLTQTLRCYNTLDLNKFVVNSPKKEIMLRRCLERSMTKSFALSSKELSTLYHLPTERIAPNLIHVISHREPPPKELPTNLKDPQVSRFGQTNFRGQRIPFGIRRIDRRRHLYVLGKSGVGKSKLLELLAKNDIDQGYGVGVLDPHGDLVDNILRFIPEHRIKDVVLFDPSDLAFPPGFNPLEHVDEEYKMRVTIGFIEIFKKLFGSNWSPRLEHVLRYTTLALLDSPNTTVLSILKMLTDKAYRQTIVKNIQDDVVKNFWVNEFAGWSEKFDNEAITPLLNKVGQFVSTNMIRNIVGQPENLFDFREIIDGRKILLMKISKGILGEENASLLGAMAITKIYQAAMSRADILEEDREDFYFYVDEFQNFATDSFDEILSESRKYRLNLTIANQFLGQLSERVRTTVFGNVGSLISFRVGGEDAKHMEGEFSPRFKDRDLINLGVRDFVTKMSVNGETHEAFSGRTLTVKPPKDSFVEECVRESRTKYAKPVEEVREQLARWDESSEGDIGGGMFSAASEIRNQEFDEPLL